MKIRSLILASLLTLSPVWAYGQTANGKVTTTAPTYTNNQAAPLSLDTSGGLRVNCVSGCSGAGNSNAQATSSAPSYSNNTSNPISQDLSGNLRTILTSSIPSGTNYIGGVFFNSNTTAKSDGVSNSSSATASSAGSYIYQTTFPYNFNGSTWDRQRGDVNGSYVQGSAAAGSAASGNPILNGGIYMTSSPSYANGQVGTMRINSTGFLAQVPLSNVITMGDGSSNSTAVNSGMDIIGSSFDTKQIVRPYLFNGATWDRQRGDTNGTWIVPSGSSSGTLNFSAILANSTNSTLVKNAAGIITEISVYNSSATIAWLKLYNASSSPTCGSGTPVGRYMIPGAASGGAGSNVSIDLGKAFSTGIAFCVTTGIADTDTGAVAASTYTVNMTYK